MLSSDTGGSRLCKASTTPSAPVPNQHDQQSLENPRSFQVLLNAILRELGRLEKLINTLDNQTPNTRPDPKIPPEEQKGIGLVSSNPSDYNHQVQNGSSTRPKPPNPSDVNNAVAEASGDHSQNTKDNSSTPQDPPKAPAGYRAFGKASLRNLRSMSLSVRSLSNKFGITGELSSLDRKILKVLERLERLFDGISDELVCFGPRPRAIKRSKTLPAKLYGAVTLVEVVTLVGVANLVGVVGLIGVRHGHESPLGLLEIQKILERLIDIINTDSSDPIHSQHTDTDQTPKALQKVLEVRNKLRELIDRISRAYGLASDRYSRSDTLQRTGSPSDPTTPERDYRDTQHKPDQVTLGNLPKDDESMIRLLESLNSRLKDHVLNFYIASDASKIYGDELSGLSGGARQRFESQIPGLGGLLRSQNSRIFALRAIIASRVIRAASEEANSALSSSSKDSKDIYDSSHITSMLAKDAHDETSQFALDLYGDKRLHSMEEVVRAAVNFTLTMKNQPTEFELIWGEGSPDRVFDLQTMEAVYQVSGEEQPNVKVQATVFPGLWKQGSYLVKTQVILH